MQKTIKAFFYNYWPLLLAFFVPFLTMSLIYIIQGVYPFGNSSLMTVDLGQQYVDFYAYYRQTFFEDPSSFFYSFSKAIGGDMVGLWAYYLTSPFNVVFLFFPHHQLPFAITFLTVLKISLTGLSFGWLLKKGFNGDGFSLAAFSISYALMGYTIVNQLNIMWLDGLIFLPLIALGIERLLNQHKGLTYSIFLALTLFANYYIGYMICLFLVGYFLFRLIGMTYPSTLTLKDKIKANLHSLFLFAWHSLLGAGLAAGLLLPTFYSLLGSKASYTKLAFDWELAYPFHEMLSKLVIGAFNFDQMPSGYPNLFIGSLAIVSFGCYFSNRAFPLRERITAVALMSLYVVSMNLKAFNMVWHAMQYPIWYPYRFSFVVCFFMILNGFRSFMNMKGLKPLETFFSVSLTAVVCLSVYQGNFDFVYPEQLVLTILFALLIIFMLIIKPQRYRWLPLVLFLITTVEMGINAQIDLSRLSYVKQDSFSMYQNILDTDISAIQKEDNDFYRIEKTFLRSKNDSFQADYPSISHFSSTFEKEIPQLFGDLGFPVGDGFIVYANGTVFTDALFGIKYYISEQNALYRLPEQEDELLKDVSLLKTIDAKEPAHPANTEFQLSLMQTKPDLRSYQPIAETNRTVLYQNPNALPIMFGSNQAILDVPLIAGQPIQLQENILNALVGLPETNHLFVPTDFTSTVYQNVTGVSSTHNNTYTKQIANQDAAVSFQFTPETNDAYYLTLSPNVKDEDASIYLNGVPFTQYPTYRDLLVLNLANLNKEDTITIKFNLKKSSLKLDHFQLYRLDQTVFSDAIDHLQQGGMTVSEHSSTHFKGEVTIQDDQQVLFTSIPYSKGWNAQIDGIPVKTEKALDSLLAVPITPGKHTVTLDYRTPLFKEGVIVSVISALFLLLTHLISRKSTTTLKGDLYE
ncbi:YfhO family protein [Carnobacterium antarcticum]|uniref:YfhO family protein n=1 Tax=Carnobacterium antarcticum TaxID=2126436 RepID=A0ABW4NRD6_9LACT|nr:YfhO family protein [Carnobacterium sp. CP1]ALV21312.1 transmembrane protein Tmp5 [Carnobacterium sp. CP1]